MVNKIPLPGELVKHIAAGAGIQSPGRASIREIVHLVNLIEKETGVRFIRMEFR